MLGPRPPSLGTARGGVYGAAAMRGSAEAQRQRDGVRQADRGAGDDDGAQPDGCRVRAAVGFSIVAAVNAAVETPFATVAGAISAFAAAE